MSRRQRKRIDELENALAKCLGALHGYAATVGWSPSAMAVVREVLEVMPILRESHELMMEVSDGE